MNQIRIGTFDCENLFLRYSFDGPTVRHKKNESKKSYEARRAAEGKKVLGQIFSEKEGFPLDWLSKDLDSFEQLMDPQRKATAAVIKANHPDIMALMEVESMEALRTFNQRKYFGDSTFKYALLIVGNDPRGIDVAVLSNFPIKHIETYVDDPWDTYGNRAKKTFARDCLVVRFDVGGKELTLFVNHLKSQIGGTKADKRRSEQAEKVAKIVQQTFGERIDFERFVVVGDLNQSPDHPSLDPLVKAPWQVDALTSLPQERRWTHLYEKGGRVVEVSQLDYILLVKSLAPKIVGLPYIERRGLAKYKGLDKYFPDSASRILKSIDKPGTEASDHCPVFVDLDLDRQ